MHWRGEACSRKRTRLASDANTRALAPWPGSAFFPTYTRGAIFLRLAAVPPRRRASGPLPLRSGYGRFQPSFKCESELCLALLPPRSTEWNDESTPVLSSVSWRMERVISHSACRSTPQPLPSCCPAVAQLLPSCCPAVVATPEAQKQVCEYKMLNLEGKTYIIYTHAKVTCSLIKRATWLGHFHVAVYDVHLPLSALGTQATYPTQKFIYLNPPTYPTSASMGIVAGPRRTFQGRTSCAFAPSRSAPGGAYPGGYKVIILSPLPSPPQPKVPGIRIDLNGQARLHLFSFAAQL